MKHQMLAQLGDWCFYALTEHGFSHQDTLYGFEPVADPGGRDPRFGELYNSLDRAIVAAIGEKYTGKRGAGGSGVGTAADWFCRMVGMDTLVPLGDRDAGKAVGQALTASERDTGPIYVRATAMLAYLENAGVKLAVHNHGK